MKRCGSSEGGGAAWDAKPERCSLVAKVFLGAIVVTDGSKSEKKNAHKKEQETKGRTKNRRGEKNSHRGYLKRPGIRVASPWRRTLCCGEDMPRNGEGLA